MRGQVVCLFHSLFFAFPPVQESSLLIIPRVNVLQPELPVSIVKVAWVVGDPSMFFSFFLAPPCPLTIFLTSWQRRRGALASVGEKPRLGLARVLELLHANLVMPTTTHGKARDAAGLHPFYLFLAGLLFGGQRCERF